MGISLKTLTIRNFMSFGDRETILPIGNMGPTLAIGRLWSLSEWEAGGEPIDGRSNGVGKTAITNAILWCLFGRLFDVKAPGDNVVNRESGANCMVKLTTNDGWTITRTRKMEGCNELLVFHNQDDHTRSTNTEAQKFIVKQFGLDYVLFVSSVFFGQFSKPFMEMQDQHRKNAIERLLNVHRINAWGEAAKEFLGAAELEHARLKAEADGIATNLASINAQVLANKDREIEYENNKGQSLQALANEIKQLKTAIKQWNDEQLPALQEMQKKWVLLRQLRTRYDEAVTTCNDCLARIGDATIKVETKAAALSSANERIVYLSTIDFDGIRSQHALAAERTKEAQALLEQHNKSNLLCRSLKQDLDSANAVLNGWKNKSGTVCASCKQAVDAKHVALQCESVEASVDSISKQLAAAQNASAEFLRQKNAVEIPSPSMSLAELARLEAEKARLSAVIADGNNGIKKLDMEIAELRAKEIVAKATRDKITIAMNENKPKYLPDEISAKIRAAESDATRLARLSRELAEKRSTHNPYTIVINELVESIEKQNKKKLSVEADLEKQHAKVVHYNYIYKAYSDRRKVKSLVLSELVPFLNKRILYYLDIFECSIKPQFTSSLGIETNKWKYYLCSGGQRMRINLSISFALHDLHLAIYGRQCNVMLFDEVDSRLDPAGVNAFANLILDDIASKRGGKGPDTVLVVSHKDEMRDAFPASIAVDMVKIDPSDDDEDGLSYAKYIT